MRHIIFVAIVSLALASSAHAEDISCTAWSAVDRNVHETWVAQCVKYTSTGWPDALLGVLNLRESGRGTTLNVLVDDVYDRCDKYNGKDAQCVATAYAYDPERFVSSGYLSPGRHDVDIDFFPDTIKISCSCERQ